MFMFSLFFFWGGGGGGGGGCNKRDFGWVSRRLMLRKFKDRKRNVNNTNSRTLICGIWRSSSFQTNCDISISCDALDITFPFKCYSLSWAQVKSFLHKYSPASVKRRGHLHVVYVWMVICVHRSDVYMLVLWTGYVGWEQCLPYLLPPPCPQASRGRFFPLLSFALITVW